VTTYRDPYIREIALRSLAEVRGEMRYPQVIGILTALLDDDRELVAAIRDALHEARKED